MIARFVLCGTPCSSASAYARFLRGILDHLDPLEAMIDTVVEDLCAVLPDLADCVALDSKAIESFAKHGPKTAEADGRRDTDAHWGKKSYRGVDQNNKAGEKVVSWFGYTLHLLVDATYELPVAWTVTKASTADTTEASSGTVATTIPNL